MNKIFILFILFHFSSVHAQNESILSLNFNPVMGDNSLELNKSYYSNSLQDSLQISKLEFYISNLRFYKNEQLVYTDLETIKLISLEDASTQKLELSIPHKLKYNAIEFDIGVDSTTSVSGAFGGDLDPINGMYWAWQSGYINFKLEGTTKACPARNNEFSFHIGGYQAPYYALRTARLKVKRNKDLHLSIDLYKFIGGIDLSNIYQVMSPNDDSILLADLLPTIFFATQ